MAAATWSLPVIPVNLSPGHTPKIVPTVKFVSTMLEPSSGSKATLNPPVQIAKSPIIRSSFRSSF